jgi:hypothetical protein
VIPPARSRDSAFNCRLRLPYAALDDAARESTAAEWETLLELLEGRLLYLRNGDRRAAA